VRDYLRGLGFALPLEDMEGHIRAWDDLMAARGDFYDYRDTDGAGRAYEVHRRSIRPAMRVCREWGSLLLNEKVQVACDDRGASEWLGRFLGRTRFMAQAQDTVVRAFGLGTGAFALWEDLGARRLRVRHYDARMVVPLTWDEDGVTECALVTRAFWRGRAVDQLQLHLVGPGGTYEIRTACFDERGREVAPEGVEPAVDTGSAWPTFAIVRPAVANTRVDMSPYGQSVFADAVDAMRAVDLTFDALVNEVDVSKMRVFLSDVMFERDESGRGAAIPFGRRDCTVFRKVMSTEDTIHEFAPALRTSAQAEAFRLALQTVGDLTGFGLTYFDYDGSGYVKTAREVSSDNSALMRNIRRHENLLEGAVAGISRAAMAAARRLGEDVPDEGEVRVLFDDSIVQDTEAEKDRDMREVGVTMAAWEYRAKWYGEDEATARARAAEVAGA
jgi:hypothetical protein